MPRSHREKLCLIGTGVMGHAFAQRLLAAGHDVTVFNRTVAKARDLAARGARIAPDVRSAVLGGDIVLVFLSDFPAIRRVLLSCRGLDLAGRVVIQMGTIAPEESRRLETWVSARGGSYLECPVLGSKAEAREGRLILMAGGSRQQFARQKRFLGPLGQALHYCGPTGSAALVKLALNQMIASLGTAFCASYALLQKNRMDPALFLGILRQSVLYAPMFDKKLPRLISRRYKDPNFAVRHMLKDVGLFLRAASAAKMECRHIDGIAGMLRRTIARGLGNEDYFAIYETVLGRRPRSA